MAPIFVALGGPTWASSSFNVQSPSADCVRLLMPPTYQKIEKGGFSEGGPDYFKGTSFERDSHAEEMGAAGRQLLQKLIAKYSDQIPSHKVALEVGPFLRPLGVELSNKHPWIVWEYDQSAAQKLANEQSATVYQVDLNRLDKYYWKTFLSAQRADQSEPSLNLGAAILSSVLNYVDHEVVLDQIIGQMTDKGILFIGNSNVGDTAMMHQRIPPNGSLLLELLLTKYPRQIEILPDSKITLDSFDGSRSGICMAVRIHKTSQGIVRDNYIAGIDLYTSYVAKPFPVSYPNPNYSKQKFYDDFWNSSDPADIDQARVEIKEEKRKWIPDMATNRIAEMEHQIELNKKLIEQVISLDAASPEFEKIKSDLRKPSREKFLPERKLLLEALNLNPHSRAAFLTPRLKDLYRRMGHVTGSVTGRP